MLAPLLLWITLTFGLTYLATSAEITEPIRIRLAAKLPILIPLLSCRACTSFWTAQAATAITLGITAGITTTPVPWHAWLYLPPTSGVAALGLIDLIAFTKRSGSGGQDG